MMAERERGEAVRGGSMIKWTRELNVNEQDEREGEGMRGTSVPGCLGFNCQPKARDSDPLSFSKPNPHQGQRGSNEP